MNTLSIRSYSRQQVTHRHDYHQLVLPILGTINLKVDSFNGSVASGECIIIKAGCDHSFTADAQARFIVADIDTLPEHFMRSALLNFPISRPLKQYLSFVEVQLEQQVNSELEGHLFIMFYALLEQQTFARPIDKRIKQVVAFIEQHIAEPLTIEKLASIACLSATQFKKVFKSNIGLTPAQYIIQVRMEKAHALIMHTDTPRQHVAALVGYQDYSAFCRRYSVVYGMPPSESCPS